MNLTYRQFEILVAAAESESFSAAAHRLGISPAPMLYSTKFNRRWDNPFGTPVTSLFFRSFDSIADRESSLATLEGFEPSIFTLKG